ncbi:MAG: zf-HC2 domain-containing protein [Clostridia bacterium]|nr:zf-HC2 domain-containing protein [Clostridia bacterium]
MRNECNIIRDILPLYIEDMVSADTAELVEEHLKNCVSCRIELQNMKREIRIESYANPKQVDALAPLRDIKRKLQRNAKTLKIVCILIVCVLLLCAFWALREHRCQKIEEYMIDKYAPYVRQRDIEKYPDVYVDVIRAFGKVRVRFGITFCEINTRSDPWTDNYAEEYVTDEYLRSISGLHNHYVQQYVYNKYGYGENTDDKKVTKTFMETLIEPLRGMSMELLVDDVAPEDIQSKDHPFDLEVYYDETMTDIQQLDEAVAVLMEYIESIGLTDLRILTAHSDAMTEAQLYNVTR